MDEMSKKIKRVQPLIRSRQVYLDQESVALENIRSQKRQVMTELKKYERLYIKEIEKLNQERQSLSRDQLPLMEANVDQYKSIWYEKLRKLQELEQREKSQLNQVLIAKTELESMSSLEDRYVKQRQAAEQLKEQGALDEAALRRFSQRIG